jgi:hypothetical protein
MASVRSTAHLVGITRQGATVLGPGTMAAARLENIARFRDFVSESMARAAEQARAMLYTKPEAVAEGELGRMR